MENRWKGFSAEFVATDTGAVPSKLALRADPSLAAAAPVFGQAVFTGTMDFVKRCGGNAEAAALNLLLVAETTHNEVDLAEGGMVVHGFPVLVVALFGHGAAGQKQASCLLLRLGHVSGSNETLQFINGANGMEDMQLKFARTPFSEVRGGPGLFHDGVNCGMLSHCLLQDFLQDCLLKEDSLESIEISRYTFKWDTSAMDSLCVGAKDIRVAPKVITRDMCSRQRKKAPAPPSSLDEFDWLGEVAPELETQQPKPDVGPEVSLILEDGEGEPAVDLLGEELAKVMEMDAASGDAVRLAAGFDAAWERELAAVPEPSSIEEQLSDASEVEDDGLEVDPAAPAIPVRFDPDLFAVDPSSIVDPSQVVRMDAPTGQVWERGGAQRLLGYAKMVGLHSVRCYCRLHPSERGFATACGFLVYGATNWDVADEKILRWFAESTCFRCDGASCFYCFWDWCWQDIMCYAPAHYAIV